MSTEKKTLLFITSLLFTLAVTALTLQPGLNKIHQTIEASYDNVQHISANKFSELSPNTLMVFDVRLSEEFNVSHLNNAFQVSPDISAEEFEVEYGDYLEGKTVVFYCSVGHRSSELASRLETVLQDNGSEAAFNLIGGVFQWHNESRKLVQLDQQQTDLVHPYNRFWGRLIEDKNAISFMPAETLENAATQ